MSEQEHHFYHTNLRGLCFSYESIFAWHERPVLTLAAAAGACYPDTERVKNIYGRPVEFPQYDIEVYEPGKPPLVFSGAHNRLMYWALNNLEPDSKRKLLLIDDHNDFFLESHPFYDQSDIHIGNWGSAGVVERMWGEIYHFDWKYRLNDVVVYPDFPVIPEVWQNRTVKFTEIDLNWLDKTIQYINHTLSQARVIETIDADEYGDWVRTFGKSNEKQFRHLVRVLFSLPNIDVIHFTPSPAYCPKEYAVRQWEIIREEYSQIKVQK